MSDFAIEVMEFKKNYGQVQAVRGINLSVNSGQLYGLIGPDGAGKTTLMRALCTLLSIDEGEVRINGLDVNKNISQIRSILGYMPQRFSLYQDLTVTQNLSFFGKLFQVPKPEYEKRLKKLFSFSRLEPFKNRIAGALSGGMKQKLALSCALIHTPQILILDEPTFGVDPVSREEFWEILFEIKKEGTTIFVSTAYMEEADQCDEVALMHQGLILKKGSSEKIREDFEFPLYRVTGKSLKELNLYFKKVEEVVSTQLFGDSLHISFQKNPTRQQWEKWSEQTGDNLTEWQLQTPSMEDVFMHNITDGQN